MAQQKEISSLELHGLLKELKELEGSWLENIYQDKEKFLFSFRTRKGKKNLRIILPGLIFISSKQVQNPLRPENYCQFLRRRIKKTKLHKIEQLEPERIIKMEFVNQERKYYLYAELFAQGNLILTDEKNKILMPLKKKKLKQREISKGKKYIWPKTKINPFSVQEKELKERLGKEKKAIVMVLAKEMGLGKRSEIVLKKAGINKTKPIQELKKKEIKKIWQALQAVIKETDQQIGSRQIELRVKKKKKKENKKIKKLKKIVKKQSERIKELKEKAEENKKKGEKIYENYPELKSILEKASKNFPGITPSEKIKKIDKKNKKILVEI